MENKIVIGTRGSQLALWQANWVKSELERLHTGVTCELLVIKTKGDKILDVPLAKVGGKGLFVKEIEEALLDGRIDMAVHSMKDMPADLPEGLKIGAIPEREDPRDALISKNGLTFENLPQGARVGTSSLRRSAQLLAKRPDLQIETLRGNIDTRLRKVTEGDLDAIILAAAGLKRLGLGEHITECLAPELMLPAVGQGALCIESREKDDRIDAALAPLNHMPTRVTVLAERAFLNTLEGSCQIPVGAFAETDGQDVTIRGLVAEVDGSRILMEQETAENAQGHALGVTVAERLKEAGAADILTRLLENQA
ncbi:hydroxymethylbilane synthase [Desulfoluna butyratoxydans]|uniref:Porphobilinogen deaminase n=1 Tax=Desulfoluna butyratoxydans TaxID=231438 RepID=A0A4U8YHL9_9BACT|nr:porphobilinogen deaminase [Desulfoluna butyratoxydans]